MVREKNHGFGEEHRERLTRVRVRSFLYGLQTWGGAERRTWRTIIWIIEISPTW